MNTGIDLSVFGSGLVFLGEVYFRFKEGWSFEGQRPSECNRCGPSQFHAHGYFCRFLLTLRDGKLELVVVWKPRWKCTGCEHTVSSNPPDVVPYRHICTLVIVALLWSYLTAEGGVHRCLPERLQDCISVRQLACILVAAAARSLETQQIIREVVLEIQEPRPMESLFPDGLDPPEALVRRTRHQEGYSQLWRALALVIATSSQHLIPIARLLAWARRRAGERKKQFLI